MKMIPFLRAAMLCQRVKIDSEPNLRVTLFEPLHTITLPDAAFG